MEYLVDDVSFKKKLEVAAKATFRDTRGIATWENWQDTLKEIKERASREWVEACYNWNKHDPEVNTEVDRELH